MADEKNNAGAAYIKQLFTKQDAHPVALNFCMLQEFGPAFLAWEAETCWDEIKKTFGVTISDANKQKVQAMRSLYVAQEPYEEWQVFEAVVSGLMGIPPRVDMIQKPTPGKVLLALDTMEHVKPGAAKEEVYRYCAAVLMDAGMIYGPGALEPCNQYITGDTSMRAQVKALANSGKVPSNFSGDSLVYVQAMKSIEVKDFGLANEAKLASQIRQVRG